VGLDAQRWWHEIRDDYTAYDRGSPATTLERIVNKREPFDLIVVGAGTAGLSCSVTAAGLGLKVAVIEQMREIGGTLHRTSGFMSAAGTRRQRSQGITNDSVELHLSDTLSIARRGFNPALIERAVRSAPETLDWLDGLGFRFHPDTPAIYYGHEPFSVPRTYWGEAAGESILEVIKPLWDRFVADGSIIPYLGHSLGELDAIAGAVRGVTVADMKSGKIVHLTGRSIVLATGGFGSNPKMYSKYSSRTATPPSAAMPGSQGAGHLAALAIGAEIRPAKEILRTGRFALKNDPTRVDLTIQADFDALLRDPREIWVNRQGRRFVDETCHVNTEHEYALLEQEDQTFWAVFDQTALLGGKSLIRGWTPEDYAAAAKSDTHTVYSADSIASLADAAGIHSLGLIETVDEWNDSVGKRQLWRNGAQMSIQTSPYYAVRCQGAILTTFSGLWLDESQRVLTSSGKPLSNLYAAGEVMGAAACSGETWVGGMCVTPALALGRNLARDIDQLYRSGGGRVGSLS